MITLQAGIELIVATLGFAYAVGQIKNTSEVNKKGLHDLKEDLTSLIENNNKTILSLLDSFKDHQKESLSTQVSHLKDLMAASSRETREDIKRLEEAQRESNRIKSRLCMVEASVKSLHKRLDMEPTLPIGEDIE